MAEQSPRSCPYDHANVFSRVTFWWMNALFKLGYKNQLTSLNVCDVSQDDESSLLESRLERYWKEEVQKYSEGLKASLFRAVLKAFKWQWILPGLLVLFVEAIKLVQPYLIGLLVTYFNNESGAVSKEEAFGIGAGLGLSAILQVCANPTYFFVMQHVALRMKVAVGALIYRKVLSLSTEAFQYTSSGQIVNHLSTDIEKFNSAIDLMHYFWVSPLSIGVVMYLMYQQVGAVCFWGLAVIVVIMPLQAGLSSVFGKLRLKIGACSDRRIQLMSEVILSMKVIKVHCWEKPFEALVSKLRRSEVSLLRWSGIFQSLQSGLETMATRFALLVIVMALWKADSIGSAEIFTSIAWLYVLQSHALRFPVQVYREIRDLHTAVMVVQSFLLLDEEKEQIKDLRLHRSISYRNEPQNDWAVDIDHMTARWPLVYTEGKRRFQKKRQRSSTSSTKSLLHESDADHAFSLKYISLQVKKGEHVAVVGVVGSGKSSLLMSLIGELRHEIGEISINGKVSYCGQTNWVFSGSAKDNILFGQSFNRNQYQHVIKACGLSRDLELLPRGDQTFVGERGLQLSGGQKARLSLARCVYHEADIYLLDDPLSAVDATVGRHIFDNCIMNLLGEKTVVLVTHQLQYLKKVNRIVVLRDGCIHDIGTYEELKSRGMDMKALTSSEEHPKHATEAAREVEEEETQRLLESKYLNVNAEADEEEEVEAGSVGIRVYWNYFCAGFGPAFLPVLLPLWFAGPAFLCLSDWMLAEWVGEGQYDKKKSGSPYTSGDITAPTVIGVTSGPGTSTHDTSGMSSSLRLYIIAVAMSTVAFVLFATVYLQMAATAGRRLHDWMLESIMNAVCCFFDTHPVGQILNRFSRDLGFIDDSVSTLGYVVAMKTTSFLAFFIVTVVVNPWLTIAVVPILAVIVLIRLYALHTLRQIKRLEAKARSPVYSHISDTVLGLETIRALGKRDQFLAEFDEHQNCHTAAWFLYLSSYRWMSVRSLAAVVIYLNIIIFVSLGIKDSVDGNLLALSLIYCIAMSEPFEFYMRASADLETYMTSVERVLGYCQLEQEPPKTSDKPPSPDWPNRGAITFTKTSLQYSSDAPLILKNIECHIKGKEKIGIVGRTGSGKSSLITSLFRLAKPTGVIYIDGVDLGKLGLHELRSKISVIPQDPILFSQTLRWNLDPLEEFSDERLWNALEQVQLKTKVDMMPGKLYTDIQEGGTNLSVGQRQLICLARAILKYNRILILDEATANVDQETDDIIQRTIRAKFRESTVLTIAHRLFTVMDCDRIMVMEEGELKEFDTPYNLLQQPEGVFSRLVQSTGKNQAKQLKALAELSQHQRASASLQLQRAMLLANEQLAQSTEDLSVGRAALSWNRFTHSQDSLDKAQVENIAEKEKKSVAPSQRIIRRRSPGKSKRTVEEEEELLSYDTPPKTRTGSDRGQARRGEPSTQGRDRAEYEERHTARTDKSEEVQPKQGRNADHEKPVIETDIDAPTKQSYRGSPVRKYRENPNEVRMPERGQSPPAPRQVGRRVQGPPRARSDVHDVSQSSPPSTRVVSGPYRPQANLDEEKEQFV